MSISVWGITDLEALKSWQGKLIEIHLANKEVLTGDLVGYSQYVIVVKVADRVVVVNKGRIAWYTNP